MLRPTRLDHADMIDLITTIQEFFYLELDDEGYAVWNPEKEVPGADLVDLVGTQLRLYGLCPQEILLADPNLTPENLLASWGHGNRKAVARVMSERTRTEIAAFTNALARGPGVEEAAMFVALLEGMELHSRRHDNALAIDKSRRELLGNGAYRHVGTGPNGLAPVTSRGDEWDGEPDGSNDDE